MGSAKKRKNERFVGIPYRVATHPNFVLLPAQQFKLLFQIWTQYNGKNNGNLTACWSVMRGQGWVGRGSLYRAFSGLKEKGFVVVTRQGKKVRGHPTLLAVTWSGIDDCEIEYDPGIKPSGTPLRYWERSNIEQIQPSKKNSSVPNRGTNSEIVPHGGVGD